jgi:LPXTG-motif cell wall-anchored protein
LAFSAPAEAARCPLVVLVWDHSGSMDSPAGGFSSGGQTKWEIAVAAIPSVMMQYDYLPWGFVPFGDPPGFSGAACSDFSQEPVRSPAPGQVPDILNLITSTLMPDGGGTNTGEAIDKAVGLITAGLAAETDRPGGYIVLMTDGGPNCNTNEPNFTIGRIADAYMSKGIKTFVIGFGQLSGTDSTNMEKMANAGGAPCTGSGCTKSYYTADSSMTLTAALNAITNTISGEFGGMCDDSCYSGGCPNGGEICVNAKCVPNPCAGVNTCAPSDYCYSDGVSPGTCVKSCPQCGVGQTCDKNTGMCVQDVCPSCLAQGKGCVNNACVAQQCDNSGNKNCKSGVPCINGVCIDDPCRWITCPSGATCQPGGLCAASSAGGGGGGPRSRGGCEVAQPSLTSSAPALLAGFALLGLAGLVVARRRQKERA